MLQSYKKFFKQQFLFNIFLSFCLLKRNGESKFGTLYQLMIEDNPDSSFIETITS